MEQEPLHSQVCIPPHEHDETTDMGVITDAGNEMTTDDAQLGEGNGSNNDQDTNGKVHLFDVRFPDEDDPNDPDYVPSDGGDRVPTHGW